MIILVILIRKHASCLEGSFLWQLLFVIAFGYRTKLANTFIHSLFGLSEGYKRLPIVLQCNATLYIN
jgi:hypothetical protein